MPYLSPFFTTNTSSPNTNGTFVLFPHTLTRYEPVANPNLQQTILLCSLTGNPNRMLRLSTSVPADLDVDIEEADNYSNPKATTYTNHCE